MYRKIDVGIDKNLHIEDPKAKKQPQLKFLADDIPKSPDQALDEATKASFVHWINSDPLMLGYTDEVGTAYLFFLSDLPKKKVVLLEITDFCLLPCRRSLRYSLEWHKRYGHSGLLIIGIHAPMFEFGKDRKVVADAVRELQIPFPVVLDNDFNIWRTFENRYWPRRILLDSHQKAHLDVVGEGNYSEFETRIQELLRELSPGLPCPPILKHMSQIDDPEYSVPETTPEIFLGLRKNMTVGNSQAFTGETEEVVFTVEPETPLEMNMVYLQGGWLPCAESIMGTPHKGDIKIQIKFTGTDAYIVARSRAKNPNDLPQGTKVVVQLDGRPLTEDKIAGTDTFVNEVRRSVIMVRDPKLYHIATKIDPGAHELLLTIDEDTLHTIEVYALFFEHFA